VRACVGSQSVFAAAAAAIRSFEGFSTLVSLWSMAPSPLYCVLATLVGAATIATGLKPCTCLPCTGYRGTGSGLNVTYYFLTAGLNRH